MQSGIIMTMCYDCFLPYLSTKGPATKAPMAASIDSPATKKAIEPVLRLNRGVTKIKAVLIMAVSYPKRKPPRAAMIVAII